jgi:hypothetical protein
MDRIIFTSMVATVVVIAAVGWMYLIPNSHVFTASSARSEEADNNNTNFLRDGKCTKGQVSKIIHYY